MLHNFWYFGCCIFRNILLIVEFCKQYRQCNCFVKYNKISTFQYGWIGWRKNALINCEPTNEEKAAEEYNEDSLRKGELRKSKPPYRSRIFFVEEHDKLIRVVDYQAPKTFWKNYNVRTPIFDMFDHRGGPKTFLTIDLKTGFHNFEWSQKMLKRQLSKMRQRRGLLPMWQSYRFSPEPCESHSFSHDWLWLTIIVVTHQWPRSSQSFWMQVPIFGIYLALNKV